MREKCNSYYFAPSSTYRVNFYYSEIITTASNNIFRRPTYSSNKFICYFISSSLFLYVPEFIIKHFNSRNGMLHLFSILILLLNTFWIWILFLKIKWTKIVSLRYIEINLNFCLVWMRPRKSSDGLFVSAYRVTITTNQAELFLQRFSEIWFFCTWLHITWEVQSYYLW